MAYSDAKRRAKRAERIRWVSPHVRHELVVGRTEVLKLLNEARVCFVDGHDIATLLTAMAAIEQILAEELVEAGLARHGTSIAELLRVANRERRFAEGLLAEVERLRLLRNPYAHLKPDGHPHSLGHRYLNERRHPDLVVEEDAKAAVVAMYATFNHVLRPGEL